jgi:hypothetical protein
VSSIAGRVLAAFLGRVGICGRIFRISGPAGSLKGEAGFSVTRKCCVKLNQGLLLLGICESLSYRVWRISINCCGNQKLLILLSTTDAIFIKIIPGEIEQTLTEALFLIRKVSTQLCWKLTSRHL